MPEVPNTVLVTPPVGHRVYQTYWYGDRQRSRYRVVLTIVISCLWEGSDTPTGGHFGSYVSGGYQCTDFVPTLTGDGIHCKYEEKWEYEDAYAWSAWVDVYVEVGL